MGSGKSKSSRPNKWGQVAGEQGYNQWSQGGAPGIMTEDNKHYDDYMTGWGMRQSEYDDQQVQQTMFNSFMSAMSGPSQMYTGPSQAPVQTESERWSNEGMFDKNAQFSSIEKQLGAAGEGQSYLYGPGNNPSTEGTIIWSTAAGENVADEDVASIAGEWANKYTGELVSQTGFDKAGGDSNWYIGDTPTDFTDAVGYTSAGQSFKNGRELRETAMGIYETALTKAESFVDEQARGNRIGQALGDYGWGQSQQNDYQELLDTWGSEGYEQVYTPMTGTTGASVTTGATGAAGSTAATPAKASTAITEEDTLGQTSLLGGLEQSSGIDPMMMQMMMAMMQSSSRQSQQMMPQMPQPLAQPQVQTAGAETEIEAEPVDWQEQMQGFRDRASASLDKRDDDSLMSAFIPMIEDEDEDESLLTETANA